MELQDYTIQDGELVAYRNDKWDVVECIGGTPIVVATFYSEERAREYVEWKHGRVNKEL